MTVQSSEILIIENNEYPLESYPLHSSTIVKKLRLTRTSTACHRGYVGKWEIINDKLYLIEINGSGELFNRKKFLDERIILRKKLKNGEINSIENGKLLKTLKENCYEKIILSTKNLFNSDSVFAEWFSGTLKIGDGDLISSPFSMIKKYEKEIMIEIKNGHVLNKQIKNNVPFLLGIFFRIYKFITRIFNSKGSYSDFGITLGLIQLLIFFLLIFSFFTFIIYIIFKYV